MDDAVNGESEGSSHDEECGELGAGAPESSNGTAGLPGGNESRIMDVEGDDGVSNFEKDAHAMINDSANANEMNIEPTMPRRIEFDTTQTGLLSEYPELFGQCNGYTRGTQCSPLAYSGVVDLTFVLWSVEAGGVGSPTLCTPLSFVLLIMLKCPVALKGW